MCALPNLKCISEYFKSFKGGAADSRDQLFKQITPDPAPSKPPRRTPLDCGSGRCGKVTGDPHLTTYDGHRYGMQAVGEFVLTREAKNEFEVQLRTDGDPDIGNVSWVTGVAVGVGDHKVSIVGDQVRIDDELVDDTDRAEGASVPGFVVRRWQQTTTITTDRGSTVIVELRPSTLDVVIDLSAEETGMVGLMGDGDGDGDNDLVTRDGRVFENRLSFDDLYGEYVASWRLTDEESLFSYGAGESTKTFTDLDFPEGPFTLDDLDPVVRRKAQTACRLAGIEPGPAFDDCVLDYAATGDIDFLTSARLNDAVDGIISGRLAPDGGEVSEVDDAAVTAWAASGNGVLLSGDEAVLDCPTGPERLARYAIWGDGRYTSDSSVCTAAVHAGVITTAGGGRVRVARHPGQDRYRSVTRNGVTSSAYGSWPSSFSVAAAA